MPRRKEDALTQSLRRTSAHSNKPTLESKYRKVCSVWVRPVEASVKAFAAVLDQDHLDYNRDAQTEPPSNQ